MPAPVYTPPPVVPPPVVPPTYPPAGYMAPALRPQMPNPALAYMPAPRYTPWDAWHDLTFNDAIAYQLRRPVGPYPLYAAGLPGRETTGVSQADSLYGPSRTPIGYKYRPAGAPGLRPKRITYGHKEPIPEAPLGEYWPADGGGWGDGGGGYGGYSVERPFSLGLINWRIG